MAGLIHVYVASASILWKVKNRKMGGKIQKIGRGFFGEGFSGLQFHLVCSYTKTFKVLLFCFLRFCWFYCTQMINFMVIPDIFYFISTFQMCSCGRNFDFVTYVTFIIPPGSIYKKKHLTMMFSIPNRQKMCSRLYFFHSKFFGFHNMLNTSRHLPITWISYVIATVI